MKKLLGTLGILLLVGCAGISVEDQVAVSCRGYAGLLNTLALMKHDHKLSVTEIIYVDTTRGPLNAICLWEDYESPDWALDFVEDTLLKYREMTNES